MSKKLDIAYFNKRAKEFDLVTDENRAEVMKVVGELAVYIKRKVNRVKRQNPWLKKYMDASRQCFFAQIFWRWGFMEQLNPLDDIFLNGLNRYFYGDLTIEIYTEYQKLFKRTVVGDGWFGVKPT